MAETSKPKNTPVTPPTGGIAIGFLALLIAIGVLNSGQTTPPKTTTTTTKATTTTTIRENVSTTIFPSGGDDSDKLSQAISAGNVVVDKPLLINKIVKITNSNRTITFTGSGELKRTLLDNPSGDKVTFPVIQIIGASNINIIGPKITGPGNVCDVPRPNGFPGVYRSVYDARYEESAGITLDGATNVRIQGGVIRDVRGDGIRIFYDSSVSPSKPSTDISITNLTTRCVGRAAIANIYSDKVTVTGGDFALSGYWIFNVEPFNNLKVTNYVINEPVVGYSTGAWLYVGGPYFQCTSSVTVNRPSFTEPVMSESVAPCVRDKVVVNK